MEYPILLAFYHFHLFYLLNWEILHFFFFGYLDLFVLVEVYNHSLLNYRELLLQYNYIKSEEIDDITNFNLIKYNSSENLIQFLMRLIPEKFMIKFEDLIELQINVKRNTNIFQGQKNCLLIVTFQGHIILFDQDKVVRKFKFE